MEKEVKQGSERYGSTKRFGNRNRDDETKCRYKKGREKWEVIL